MTDLSITAIIVLHLVAFIAGFVSAVAGGGGLIVLPALLAAGLSPLNALATTKIQGMFGILTSTHAYARSGFIDFRRLRTAMLLAAVFAVLGVMLVQNLKTSFLQKCIPVALLFVSLYMLFYKAKPPSQVKQKISDGYFNTSIGTATGFYIGVFGPGIGSFLIVAFSGLRGDSLKLSVANSKAILLAGNALATLTFTVSGHVWWALGLGMSVIQIIGAHFGAKMAITNGDAIIRPMCLIVTIATVLYLLFSPR